MFFVVYLVLDYDYELNQFLIIYVQSQNLQSNFKEFTSVMKKHSRRLESLTFYHLV